MLAEPGDMANPPTRAAMEGLRGLASRATLWAPDGWRSPYGWLTAPAEACAAVLDFIDEKGMVP